MSSSSRTETSMRPMIPLVHQVDEVLVHRLGGSGREGDRCHARRGDRDQERQRRPIEVVGVVHGDEETT